jgi:hypothetical protein
MPYIAKDTTLLNHSGENLKSYILILSLHLRLGFLVISFREIFLPELCMHFSPTHLTRSDFKLLIWKYNPYSTSSRPPLGSTQPPIQQVPRTFSPEVKRPGRETDHSPPTNA